MRQAPWAFCCLVCCDPPSIARPARAPSHHLKETYLSHEITLTCALAGAMTSPAPAKPHISSKDPTQLFQLLGQIGSGSYGTVQKARIIKTGALAAVKLITMEDGES